jgi:hypothetical protein
VLRKEAWVRAVCRSSAFCLRAAKVQPGCGQTSVLDVEACGSASVVVTSVSCFELATPSVCSKVTHRLEHDLLGFALATLWHLDGMAFLVLAMLGGQMLHQCPVTLERQELAVFETAAGRVDRLVVLLQLGPVGEVRRFVQGEAVRMSTGVAIL